MKLRRRRIMARTFLDTPRRSNYGMKSKVHPTYKTNTAWRTGRESREAGEEDCQVEAVDRF